MNDYLAGLGTKKLTLILLAHIAFMVWLAGPTMYKISHNERNNNQQVNADTPVPSKPLVNKEVYSEESTYTPTYFDTIMSKYDGVAKSELAALTVALYCESRGESWYGIAAVADTIRNRVRSKLFPDSYYQVVTQPGQFSCIIHKRLQDNIIISGEPDKKKLAKLAKLAMRTIVGDLKPMTYNALFYHTTKVDPYWVAHYEKLGVVGNHVFYTTSKL